MLYMIFQYDSEPVLIQRILIGFEAILEKVFEGKTLQDCYSISTNLLFHTHTQTHTHTHTHTHILV